MTEQLAFGQPLGGIMEVAYVVEDLEAAMDRWTRELAVGPWFLFQHFPLANAQYRGQPCTPDIDLALGFSGSMCFELIRQNNDDPSVYMDVVNTRGYGFHHWAISTRDFDGDIKRYQSMGAELALYGEVPPVEARAAYMDTTATLGGMVELIEINDKVNDFFATMYMAAQNWDGSDPVRTL
ncbi:MAG: VOC family protein [Alphaproteobacteria bacterium]|nr:MAG: VOC family protein [Alphaproteobacteria bacterium]